MTQGIEQRLASLGIVLPEAAAPVANYVPFAIVGTLVFISGQISRIGGETVLGKLGDTVSLEGGRKAARYCGLNLLAQLRAACGGSLDRTRRCVKLTGFVNSTPLFTQSPDVINGASDLMVEVLGEAGRHARVAVSVASLPLGVAVEVDGVFEIAP